jgi:hypothetical protein
VVRPSTSTRRQASHKWTDQVQSLRSYNLQQFPNLRQHQLQIMLSSLSAKLYKNITNLPNKRQSSVIMEILNQS